MTRASLLVEYGIDRTTILNRQNGTSATLRGPAADQAQALVALAGGAAVHVEATGLGLGFAELLHILGANVFKFRLGAQRP